MNIFRNKSALQPQHELGLTFPQLEEALTPEAYTAFCSWIRHQTCGIHEITGEGIAFIWDFERWLKQQERIDDLPTEQDPWNWD